MCATSINLNFAEQEGETNLTAFVRVTVKLSWKANWIERTLNWNSIPKWYNFKKNNSKHHKNNRWNIAWLGLRKSRQHAYKFIVKVNMNFSPVIHDFFTLKWNRKEEKLASEVDKHYNSVAELLLCHSRRKAFTGKNNGNFFFMICRFGYSRH